MSQQPAKKEESQPLNKGFTTEGLQQHFAQKRIELLERVAEIESFLGFIEQSGDLSVRVAKLEAFIGMPK